MATVDQQIRRAADACSSNIDELGHDRGLLAQNILSQLRNLAEGVAVRLREGDGGAEFHFDKVRPAMNAIKNNRDFGFIFQFHKLLQKSASHYTLGRDPSERLMLKYYDYLRRIRKLATTEFGMEILANLEAFPVDLDPSLREYHENIAELVEVARLVPLADPRRDRYYIHSTRPFYANGQIYYEVTFYDAVNRSGKSDRVIGFTDIDMTDRYAANLVLQDGSIEILGRLMPITIIREWEVSIRPCELEAFARIFGLAIKVSSGSPEYRRLMFYLTDRSANLIDVIGMGESRYASLRTWCLENSQRARIFAALDEARRITLANSAGANVVRYLLLQMKNQIIKQQAAPTPCHRLSSLCLAYGCIPFDEMPFCTSLIKHNPRLIDVVESIDLSGREHELLARRVRDNVEQEGRLYTPVCDLDRFDNVDALISTFNSKLYHKHRDRKILQDMRQVFIKGYEDGAVSIIERLQLLASSGREGHADDVRSWLRQRNPPPDDPLKSEALETLFDDSRVALIYGAAGTGKSTMVGLIADYFCNEKKLFLAHTNPAVDNLQRRVEAPNSTFKTISSHNGRPDGTGYEVLIVDECSTVSNADLLSVLDNTTFRLLVLVGDVYQIGAIQFGNWFNLARRFVPTSAVFELTKPHRTDNAELLGLWSSVRELADDIAETLARYNYSSVLDQSLFESQHDDEIILCLNYDGLYGINNVNRFLQGNNPESAVSWGASIYKVGDPVLFNESDRFRPVIFNNLKGRIVAIETFPDRIRFDISLERSVTQTDLGGIDLRYVGDSTVQFDVLTRGTGDEDDDSNVRSVPFQVAYAVSIHKAQGLEYNSVKIVVTDANEDDISHNVFYTAITRAREHLRIFWTPETEHAILTGLKRTASGKDASLLEQRRGLSRM